MNQPIPGVDVVYVEPELEWGWIEPELLEPTDEGGEMMKGRCRGSRVDYEMGDRRAICPTCGQTVRLIAVLATHDRPSKEIEGQMSSGL